MRYRVLLFDLFGTLVHIKPILGYAPGREAGLRPVEWLREPVHRDLPGVSFDDFLAVLLEVTGEIVRARPPEYIEVDSPIRFRRALDRLGVDGTEAEEIAERLCRAHMGYLAEQTEMPESHAILLRRLGGEYRLGLVSNFDHGPTAHEILDREGIASLFEVTLISADFGRRKPHPAIFEEALRRFAVDPPAALFIGDTIGEDVSGARAAAVDVVWINPKGEGVPPDGPQPTFIIDRLADLEGVLSDVDA
jgi:HAD superfamily hydrolase (TIGR01549 family)